MRFTTREDIELPIDAVFAEVADFQRFEREALRRGASVETGGAAEGIGRSWTVRFRHRGRDRELVSTVERWDPPRGLGTLGRIGGFEGQVEVELTELAPRRTRLKVDLDIKPRTLTARLMLQSLKLAKSSLTNRYKARVHGFARAMEQRRQTPAR